MMWRRVMMTMALMVAWPGVASADIISMEQSACSDKAEGDACEVEGGISGVCTKGQRCRPTPDGVDDCTDTLFCEEERAREDSPADTTPAQTTPTDTTPAEPTPDDSDGSSEPSRNGCAQSGLGGAGTGALSLMAGLALLGLARRRDPEASA